MRWMWMLGLAGACAAPVAVDGGAPQGLADAPEVVDDETAAPLDVFDDSHCVVRESVGTEGETAKY